MTEMAYLQGGWQRGGWVMGTGEQGWGSLTFLWVSEPRQSSQPSHTQKLKSWYQPACVGIQWGTQALTNQPSCTANASHLSEGVVSGEKELNQKRTANGILTEYCKTKDDESQASQGRRKVTYEEGKSKINSAVLNWNQKKLV